MLLPVDLNDPMRLYQTGFKVTSFSHTTYSDPTAIYESVEFDLRSDDGHTATAAIVFVSEEEPRPGRYDPEKSFIRLDTLPATGQKFLDMLFRAAGCQASEVSLCLQYDADRQIGDFWLDVRVALGASGSVH